YADNRRPYRFGEEALDEARVLATIASAALERVRLFDELRRSEEHFRSIIELGSDVITILDREGRACYQSPSIERVLGYSTDELIGKDPLALIHPDDREGVQ